MSERPTIAAFRPPGERAERARETLENLGAHPLIDPMVEPIPTGALPRHDGEVIILTSSTAAEILEAEGWQPDESELIAIGPRTGEALRQVGLTVDRIPQTYTSAGLVEELSDEVDGRRVEIARSDHGSDELPRGLWETGAYVHETVLYRLDRPPDAGRSVEAALGGELDGLAFTSSLTVEHFLALASERDRLDELLVALEEAVIGAIGPPTAETARSCGLHVDVVASEATFDTLAEEVVAAIESDPSRSV